MGERRKVRIGEFDAFPERGETHGLRFQRDHSDGGIVEGTNDSLRSALTNPVCRPECVEAGVEGENSVAVGKITDRARDRLRMNAILAAREISLFVQLFVPVPT